LDVSSPAFLQNPYEFSERRRLQGPLIKGDQVSRTRV